MNATQRPHNISARGTRNFRGGATSLTMLIGGVLWVLVFVAMLVLWFMKQQPDTKSPASGQGVAAATAPDLPKTDTAQEESPNAVSDVGSETSVHLSFPTRDLPDFTFDEAAGGTVSKGDLKGKPWVASFIFTRCVTTCPTITLAVKRLHDRVIKDNPDVQFVTFTVDPAFDTVEVMQQYSDAFSPDRERWKFLTGSQDEVFALILHGFGLYVKENIGESRRPGFEVAHSNRVVLVNEEGVPVGTFLATNEDDMASLRQILTGRKPFPEPGPPLTITRSDGSPVPIELQARPVDSEEVDSEEDVDEDNQESPAADGAGTAAEGADDADGGTSDASENAGSESASAAVPGVISVAEHNAKIEKSLPNWAKPLPAVNASLNGLATFLLTSGYAAIRSGRVSTHRNLMVSAFVISVLFLVSYLGYHYALGKYTGEHGRRFGGEGIWAVIYPLVLWPHVALAATVPFLAIGVFRHAFAERWEAHKRLARVTLPIWLYVSVTGVVIYGMLYHWPQSA